MNEVLHTYQSDGFWLGCVEEGNRVTCEAVNVD